MERRARNEEIITGSGRSKDRSSECRRGRESDRHAHARRSRPSRYHHRWLWDVDVFFRGLGQRAERLCGEVRLLIVVQWWSCVHCGAYPVIGDGGRLGARLSGERRGQIDRSAAIRVGGGGRACGA